MNYFLDTEFYENGTTIQLISIAIVCEDGRELYCERSTFNWAEVPRDHWLHANVFPHLEHGDGVRCSFSQAEIARKVRQFVHTEDESSRVCFWGYFADYDWVVLCQLFGAMVHLPKGFPFFCMDLKQSMAERGLGREWKNRVCPDPKDEHHALADARWNRDLFKAIQSDGVACPSGMIIP